MAFTLYGLDISYRKKSIGETEEMVTEEDAWVRMDQTAAQATVSARGSSSSLWCPWAPWDTVCELLANRLHGVRGRELTSKRVLVATHSVSHPLPCAFPGSRAPAAGWGCKTSFRERYETPTSAMGWTGKPICSPSPHHAVSPKRPYHTAVCLPLSLISLLVNFLHTTLHLSGPLGTPSRCWT